MNQNINAKRWLKTLFLLCFFVAGMVGSINYVVDPYGLNNFIKIKKFNFYKKSNTGYAFRFKTDVFKSKNFDTVMIGTSRVGVMDPSVVDDMLGATTFNFASSGSITEIQRDLFFYSLRNNKIKNVIYGIDFLSLNGTITLKNKFKEFCQVQEKLKNNQTIYNYDLYFNWETLSKSYDVVMKNFQGKGRVTKYYRDNGMRDYVDYEEELKEGSFDYDKEITYSLKSYYSPKRKGGYQNYVFSYHYLDYIREVVEYCKKNDIQLWVYIPPMDKKHFDALMSYGIYKEFELFKKELVKIVNYTDFTGHNSITDNHENFWEGSHLKKELTSMVMSKVLNDKSIDVAEDFGIYVTLDNIMEHLKKVRKSVQYFDINSTVKE